MQIEIWSDVMCPFCYIGKRRFESALNQFGNKDKVSVEWKSFQLNPALKTDPAKSINEHLAEIKGWDIEYARDVNNKVTQMALGEGLHYDFDKAIVANSFDAHRLIQYAKTMGKGDAMEEALFKAYFTEGKNIANHPTLIQLALEAGLDEAAVKEILQNETYADKVELDIYESRQIGVRGVPFFLFNRRYAVSGAQPIETFKMAFDKAWAEEEQNALQNQASE